MSDLPHEDVEYLCSPIRLSEAATPEELISALIKRGVGESGHCDFDTFKILETRVTNMPAEMQGKQPMENYLAVLLDTNLGRKIVLLQPVRPKGIWAGWWFKIYDAK